MDSLYQNQRDYISKTLSGYWKDNGSLISELPIPVIQVSANLPSPPKMDRVPLPDWAQDIGVEGEILIPHELIFGETGSDWQKVDWLGAAFWYLNGTAERAFEQAQGPIHSNSFRLKGWDPRIWERAWVNRIALFLRRWATVHHAKRGKPRMRLADRLLHPWNVRDHPTFVVLCGSRPLDDLFENSV